ncbi:DUF2306 domain-containing protein [Myceligenerans pegani]|uniref:DUF2306 domain-containing protein n=1 Tax=Myceligenerans pegani TaxID=2776917 RepID=A0ABR9MYM4_9MICO|nr:DUF2306 domain-containing protein [Myceligenerans sp. TRM 65318]MBE1876500.1 DUF2306 domain-containing protein [Myceligenerans sp. TRM 65318]MBE3018771.1 DUF2306 domain-containing protein [Myceligenerans sp. TRM 65318]
MSSTTTRPAVRPRSRPADWLIPSGLVLLSAVPALGGALRVTELAGDPAVTEENARFVEAPLPVLVHIVAVTVYSLLGALQFSPGFRRRRNAWHRAAGTVLIPAGLATALSGLWMTAFYDLPAKDTAVVNGVRYVVGTVMVAALVLAVRALRRHDYVTHGAWMTRAYALAMGAGTQAVLLGPWLAVANPQPDDPTMPVVNTILMTLAWVINALVAEWVILRRRPGKIAR